MKSFEQCRDEVAYRLYKTDYKYVGSDICKVAIMEEVAKIYAKEVAIEAVKLARRESLILQKYYYTEQEVVKELKL